MHRTFSLAIACAVLCGAADASAQTALRAGNPSIDQYVPALPDPDGPKPIRPAPTPGPEQVPAPVRDALGDSADDVAIERAVTTSPAIVERTPAPEPTSRPPSRTPGASPAPEAAGSRVSASAPVAGTVQADDRAPVLLLVGGGLVLMTVGGVALARRGRAT